MPDIRSLLLDNLRDAYERKAWHGPNLRGALRGVTALEAARRPADSRHNIWELMLHCAYWKYTVRRRLLGDRTSKFPRHGSNFFPTPDAATEEAWRDDLKLLGDAHRALIEAVATLPAAKLASSARSIYGVAAHDVYHTGQIQLLKRL
jgi:hypothetical protein